MSVLGVPVPLTLAADRRDDDARAADRLERLRAVLRLMERVVVAFSGGADSAFLAAVATDTLGPDHVLCVTAVSPSLAPEELDDCRRLADEWGLRWQAVATEEISDPAYRANDADRCYHCKTSLLGALTPRARAEGAEVLLGVNLDDLGDHRPGQRPTRVGRRGQGERLRHGPGNPGRRSVPHLD